MLHVLYLIFNEGYTATSGERLHRADLTREAIRLTRDVRRLLPDDGEVAGLLALMLLTDARGAARTGPDGELVPLGRAGPRPLGPRPRSARASRWSPHALTRAPLGPYQVQAAIAAVHAEAARAEDTDWPQIVALYDLLERARAEPDGHAQPTPSRSRWSTGPRPASICSTPLRADARLRDHHRLDAVRAHLLELAGDRAARARGVPGRGAPHDQPARAALPRGLRRAAGRRRAVTARR